MRWVGHAASGVALLYGFVVLAEVLAGRREFAGLPHAAWPGAVVLLVGAVTAAAATRTPRRTNTDRLLEVVLWIVAASSLAGSCWVLLSLIELVVTGTVHDGDGNDGRTMFAERLALVGVAALFAATAAAWRRRRTGRCVRCGGSHASGVSSEPRPAPKAVRRIAYAGCAAFVPYLFMHTLGAAGVAGIEPDGYRPPWVALAGGLVAVGLAVFLLLGLVRPWGVTFPRWTLWAAGRRVPRFLPLVPVWLIAPTLALYGTGLVGVVLFTEAGRSALVGAAGVSFGGYGWALAIAAVSYQIRTRPSCAEPS